MSPISIISLSSESKLFSISLSASKERLSVADVGGRYQAITKNAFMTKKVGAIEVDILKSSGRTVYHCYYLKWCIINVN